MANPLIAEGVVLQKPFHYASKYEINVSTTHVQFKGSCGTFPAQQQQNQVHTISWSLFVFSKFRVKK